MARTIHSAEEDKKLTDGGTEGPRKRSHDRLWVKPGDMAGVSSCKMCMNDAKAGYNKGHSNGEEH